MSTSNEKCFDGYTPAPIDTSDVIIPDELKQCVDALARNTHEVWAAGKLRQGWQYGAALDQERKRHPDLIPYDQLPDGEKSFDINTTQEIIKVLLKLGYTVTKP